MACTHRFFFLMIVLTLTAGVASAQTGTPPFGSFGGGPDVINLSNLNSHIDIPVISKPGRGTNFTYTLSYDSTVWYPVGSSGSQSWQHIGNWGWASQTQAVLGYVSYGSTYTTQCLLDPGPPRLYGTTYWYKQWYYVDEFGTFHSFGSFATYDSDCSVTSSGSATAIDGSGYKLYATGPSGYAVSREGKTINTSTAPGFTDRNGNKITVSGGVVTDTLGTTALTISGSVPNPVVFTYTAPSGASAAYSMRYSTYTVQTAFGCSGISEYPPTSNSLVNEIDLPDIAVNPNDKFTFTYETTPGDTHSPHYVTGRLASITLPTGGTITYKYTGGSSGNITCADGSTSGLQRYTPDTGSNYWNYARTPGSGAAYTTTVTDPSTAANNTVIQFQGIYETQRDFYQGTISTSNLLQTIKTCYNSNTSNCTSTPIALPITQRNITTVLPSGKQSEHDNFWNTNGAPIEADDYDYGAAPHGALLKKTLATYASLGDITAFSQNVTVQDGSGITVSKITYNYDETAPTVTSGTPQHTSVTGARGNTTSANTYVNATTYLSKTMTYYDTGNPNTTTDVNGGVTTFNYASGAASCYNSFPTSITEAITTLSMSMTWNCAGGVRTQVTDENGKNTTTAYTDAYFWRPASVTDPTNAATSFCYGLVTGGTCTLIPTQVESTLSFNSGTSTVDTLTTLDGLGRSNVQQTRQAPGSSNFDSVESDYDALGRVRRVTLPYSGTAGQTNSSVAATTTSYDALSRPLTVLDGGNGSTIYYYGQPGSQNNDVLVTRSPAATGENTKRRQFEYDGLGRLTSVCEVTAGTTPWPGGNCAQQTPNTTGYLTNYTYDPMGNLMTVTQNAQATSSLRQSRSYVYDWMSRMISETVPEIGPTPTGNGTAYYTYDSDSTCGTFKGDLVKRVDAASNTICSTYDLLHRQLTITYPSGIYASVTPQKYFVYDAATINTTPTPTAMVNPKARLAEAYTCFSPCSTKVTDIGLSYTLRGEISDMYESTPNSGGFYYHTSQSYWANGLPYQLGNNIASLPVFTVTPDGEGRTNAMSASSGQNPVSSTVYNTAGLATSINLGSGSGDADTFTWDPSTNRMTQYKFTVNGTSLTAALGWNANGTLQTQNITDGFNTADTQNCSYGYDDITRLTNANCGSAAAQTFAYDPFGNINKSGSPYSFLPTYSTSTNRMTAISSFTPTYDNNGNVTNDSFHTYAWDAHAHAITIDVGRSGAVSVTYDALGRMVEQSRSGGYTQIAYSPAGQKLALMSGQTLQKAVVPLSGKAFAVYNSSGLLYYAHPDMLGSIRLATTPARANYFDTAYAPFGETYATSGTLDPAYTGQMNDTSHRQDTAGGLYDFPARNYSTQGRWPNPDPLGAGATCPIDPQSQNRYAYVKNNPITQVDPLGLYPNDALGSCKDFIYATSHAECAVIPNPDGQERDRGFHIGISIGLGGGGGGGGGGSGPERPRYPFPWPLIPPGLFNSLGLGFCSCVHVKVPFLDIERQGTGCSYICVCEGGIVIARSNPNLKLLCQVQPCPDTTFYRPKPGSGPVGPGGTFYGGAPTPWCH
jgi:RHS repeat-associated protein